MTTIRFEYYCSGVSAHRPGVKKYVPYHSTTGFNKPDARATSYAPTADRTTSRGATAHGPSRPILFSITDQRRTQPLPAVTVGHVVTPNLSLLRTILKRFARFTLQYPIELVEVRTEEIEVRIVELRGWRVTVRRWSNSVVQWRNVFTKRKSAG